MSSTNPTRSAPGAIPVLLAALSSFLLQSGCVARGAVENPVARNITWFSYVGGEDIRQDCGSDRPSRIRFVYNAVWGKQVRTYDLVASRTGEGGVLIERVFGGGVSLAEFDPRDLLAAWRGAYERVEVSDAQARTVVDALNRSNFTDPAPKGLWLRSDDYYWTVSVCSSGKYHFNAWSAQQTDLAALPFVGPLLRLDRTGVAMRQPRKETLPPFDAVADPKRQTGGDSLQAFRLEVGENGLKTGPGLF